MPRNNSIQFRKGSSSEWISNNPVLSSGEPGYDLSNKILKVGDGTSTWTQLSGINQNIVAGYDISVTNNSGIYTIASTNLVHTDSQQPQGFVNRTDSRISVSGNIFRIEPTGSSYSFYNKGIKVTKTSGNSLTIPNLTQINYIHFDTVNNQLSNKTTSFDFSSDIPIAYVAWNSGVGPSGQMTFFAEERHGIVMDTSTHKWIHNTFGAQYVEGLSISNYSTSGNGSSNSDATIAIGNGTLYQEDIEINITDSSSTDPFCQELSPIAQIPVYYHQGSTGQWVKNTATNYPVKYDVNGPQYNLLTGGTWTTPDVSPNGQTKYFAVWILATNQIDDPIISIMGQRVDSNQGSAESNNSWSDVNLTNLPLSEVKPLYRLIFAGDSDYTNVPKCRLLSILDIRVAVISTIAGVTQNDHGNLFGLGDDDHSQYLHVDNARTVNAIHNFANGINLPIGDYDSFIKAPTNPIASVNFYLPNDLGVSDLTFATTSNKISDFAFCTSSQLATKISDETGSGRLVFNNSPTLSGIVSVSGNITINGTGVSVSGHTHTSSNITDFNTSVSGLIDGIYAPLSGAIFTGNISAPSGNFTSLTVSGISVSTIGASNINANNRLTITNDTLGTEIYLEAASTSSESTRIVFAGYNAPNGSIEADESQEILNFVGPWKLNNSGISVEGHTHTSSNITDFNSSVSGLLPANLVTGSGVADHIPYWSSTSGLLADSSQLYWNSTNNRLGIGTSTPSTTLNVSGTTTLDGNLNFTTATNRISWDNGTEYLGRQGDSIIIGTQGTNKVFVSSPGNVGIGTDSPGSKLDVRGSAVFNEEGSDADFRIEGDTDANLFFVDASTDRVGIGTSSPQSKVHITDTNNLNTTIEYTNTTAGFASGVRPLKLLLTASNGVGVGAGVGIDFVTKSSSTEYTGARIVSNRTDTSNNHALTFWAGGGTTALSEYMRISSNGNVGIGTTTPSSQLHVVGSGLFSVDVTASGSFIGGSGTASLPSFEFVNDPDTGLFSPAANAFGISTSGVERLRVDSSGNIGIGTSSPTYKLQVNGNFGATTKSFRIDHPSKKDHSLEYGSLESPYHGVRLTGRDKVIKGVGTVSLPDYLKDLIHDDDTLNIQITNIKHGKTIYIDKIDLQNDRFIVKVDRAKSLGELQFFWTLSGVRKDVDHLVVEKRN